MILNMATHKASFLSAENKAYRNNSEVIFDVIF
ncbi:hypothetical protein FORMB_13560 [Formosa sp. Hel1_33_131]|jgi:hypothetical protein|nr:hypothetical protein FORMB_13560 [Formosa sp. Hel1_33_131]